MKGTATTTETFLAVLLGTAVKEKPIDLDDTQKTGKKNLILYDDNVNTIEFVIDSLVAIVNHTNEQAHQCALTAHLKGKCDIKSGDFNTLKPIYDELCFLGLTVAIE